MKYITSLFHDNNNQSGILNSLIISITSGIILIIFRVIYSGDIDYLFLIWNLFLAYIPFFISRYIELKQSIQRNTGLFMVLLLFWILFFPNAPYIITDYFHLFESPGVPLWLDLIILTIFAWNGLIAGFLSLHSMQKIITNKFSAKTGWISVVLILVMASFGVYIGRYLRYNSWDVFLMPYYLFRDIGLIAIYPGHNKDAYGMTIGLSMFLITAYFSFYRLTIFQKK